jgi:hypothetical protein
MAKRPKTITVNLKIDPELLRLGLVCDEAEVIGWAVCQAAERFAEAEARVEVKRGEARVLRASGYVHAWDWYEKIKEEAFKDLSFTNEGGIVHIQADLKSTWARPRVTVTKRKD